MITDAVDSWRDTYALMRVLGWPLWLALSGAAVLMVSHHRRR
jgi:hypothetical protein